MPATRALSTLAILAVLAACGGSGGPSEPNSLPLTGTFNGEVAAGSSIQKTFVAGRTGGTIVKVCGREGTNFDILVGSASASTSSNCERLQFDASFGASIKVTITAVSGGGPFNGCWSTTLAECTVNPPASAAVACTEPGYFDAAIGKSGSALRQALATIIATNRYLGYLTTPNTRDSLYAFVDDPDGDDMITDLYVGRTGFVNSRATAFTAGFETEHTWPQSRGADTDLAPGTDLNILFTADSQANRIRSNYPFGIVTQNVQWTSGAGADVSRLGQDAQGRVVFEPRASKRGTWPGRSSTSTRDTTAPGRRASRWRTSTSRNRRSSSGPRRIRRTRSRSRGTQWSAGRRGTGTRSWTIRSGWRRSGTFRTTRRARLDPGQPSDPVTPGTTEAQRHGGLQRQ